MEKKVSKKEYDRKWYKNHRKQCSAYAKKYYHTHLEKERERRRKYKKSHPEKIKADKRKWWWKHREERLIKSKEWYKKTRLEALQAYGGLSPRCAWCGENKLEFLTFHHKDDNGKEHRKEIGGSAKLPYWLKKNNYPKGIEILCWNCNTAHTFYNYSPNRKENQCLAIIT